MLWNRSYILSKQGTYPTDKKKMDLYFKTVISLFKRGGFMMKYHSFRSLSKLHLFISIIKKTQMIQMSSILYAYFFMIWYANICKVRVCLLYKRISLLDKKTVKQNSNI
jgi:hypothetical protein